MADGEYFQTTNLKIPVELIGIIAKSNVLVVNLYSEENKMLGQESEFMFDMQGKKTKFRVLWVKKEDGKTSYKE